MFSILTISSVVFVVVNVGVNLFQFATYLTTFTLTLIGNGSLLFVILVFVELREAMSLADEHGTKRRSPLRLVRTARRTPTASKRV